MIFESKNRTHRSADERSENQDSKDKITLPSIGSNLEKEGCTGDQFDYKDNLINIKTESSNHDSNSKSSRL